MRPAAFLCVPVLALLASTAWAVDQAAVFADKGGVDDATAAQYRSAFAGRMRTGGFIVVEVQGVGGPDAFVGSLDRSLGKHGPYRLFGVVATPRGKKTAVTVTELDPKTLVRIDAITSLTADPGEFERMVPGLIAAFLPQFAPQPPPAEPAPVAASEPIPPPAPPFHEPQKRQGLFAASPRQQPCYKEPGEFLWGLGALSGVNFTGETAAQFGGMLQFTFETEHLRIDLDFAAAGGSDAHYVEIAAGGNYLFSTAPTSFFIGGGVEGLWIAGKHGVDMSGYGGGADIRLGVEFLRHHRSRFIIEGKMVMPFFLLEADSVSTYGTLYGTGSSTKSDQYTPVGILTLLLLW